MAFKPYKPGVGSKGEERASEEAFQRRKPVAKPVAKPTVKAVRDESRKTKAAVVASKATASPKYRGGSEGDGKTVGRQSSGPVSRGAPKTLDTATSFPMGKGTAAIPKKVDPGQAKRYPGKDMEKQRRGMGMWPNQRSVMVR